MGSPDKTRLHTVIGLIPPGSVVAYGQLAELAGYPGRSRWVGRELSQLPADTELPWHRVVNASGVITCPRADLAAERLIAEGVAVKNHRVNLRTFQWRPGERGQ